MTRKEQQPIYVSPQVEAIEIEAQECLASSPTINPETSPFEPEEW